MDLTHLILLILLGVFALAALGRILRAPVRLALKLLGNTLLGFLALWVVGRIAPGTGIGLNWANALIVGVMGLPGFLFLLLVRWVL